MSVISFPLFKGREFQYGPALSVAAREPNRVLVYYPLGSGKTLAAIHAAKTFLDQYPEGEIIIITTKTNVTTTWKANIDLYTDYVPDHLERILGADVANIDWWFSQDNRIVAHYNRLIRALTEKKESRRNCIQMTVDELRSRALQLDLRLEWREFRTQQQRQLRKDLKGYERRSTLKEKDLSGLRRLCRKHQLTINETMIQKSIPTVPYIFIVDESQDYVNLTAQSELVQSLADSATFTLLLSATPVHDSTKKQALVRLLGGRDMWKKKFLYAGTPKSIVQRVPINKVVLTALEWRTHQLAARERSGGQCQNAYLCRTRMACNADSKWDAMAAQIGSDTREWKEGPLRIVVYSFFIEHGIEGFLYHLGVYFKGRIKKNKVRFKIDQKQNSMYITERCRKRFELV